jgi:putative oxidoreductase
VRGGGYCCADNNIRVEGEGCVRLIQTLLRVLVGGLFVGHGTQKLLGWFGGYGPDATGQFFESIGIRPGKRHAVMAGAAEAGGGALLALGLFTPVAGTLLTSVMTQAVRSVKLDKGPWAAEGGWELEVLYAAAALAFVDTGPGPISLDHALGAEKSGTGWALLALATGVAGPLLLVRGEEAPDAQPPEAAQDAATAGAAAPETTP